MAAETAAVPVTKTVKEKKPKVPKEKKPKDKTAASAHPPYYQMIKEAITALHERNGSSAYAIAKYMDSQHKAVLPENYKKRLGLQLKNFTAKGKLVKIKASFKLAADPVKEKKTAPAKKVAKPTVAEAKPKTTKKPVEKKAATTKPVEKKAAATTKPPVAKKPAMKKKMVPKKAAAAKPKRKSIKSIKSPAAKKAKKM